MGPDLPFSQQCIGTRRGRSARRRQRPSAGWRPMSSSRHSTEPGTGALYGTGYRGTLRSQLKGALRSQVLYSELCHYFGQLTKQSHKRILQQVLISYKLKLCFTILNNYFTIYNYIFKKVKLIKLA